MLAQKLTGIIDDGLAKVADKFAPTAGAVLNGAAGRTIARSLGGLAARKMGGSAFSSAGQIIAKAGSPIGQTAIRGFVSGASAAATGENRTVEEIESQLQQNLGFSYLASASESLSTGALDSDSLPSQIPNIGGSVAVGAKVAPKTAKSIVEDARLQDPEAHRTAALEGYNSAGFTPESSQSFADFHAKRIQILQSLNIEDPIEFERSKKVLEAVTNPSAAVGRMQSARATTEDVQVVKELYPEYSKEVSESARLVLESQKLQEQLSSQQRSFLAKVEGGTHKQKFNRLVQAIQTGYPPPGRQDEQQAGQRGAPSAGENLTLATQAGGLQSAQANLV